MSSPGHRPPELRISRWLCLLAQSVQFLLTILPDRDCIFCTLRINEMSEKTWACIGSTFRVAALSQAAEHLRSAPHLLSQRLRSRQPCLQVLHADGTAKAVVELKDDDL